MNQDMNYGAILSASIAELRKSAGMTQDALAEKLGVTFQAVSKWENGLAMPDITFLPRLSEIFGVTVDSLFGLAARQSPKTENIPSKVRVLDWDDDGVLRAVLFVGNRITDRQELTETKFKFTFEYDGTVRDVISDFSVSCGDVEGNVTTEVGNINCSDIDGDVSAESGNINCSDIGGDATTASGSINCCDIDGDATTASGSISCGDIGGDATTASGSISCGDIGGDAATVRGSIKCGDIGGDATIGDCKGDAKISCADVGGDVIIKGDGSVTVTGDIEGNVTATTVIRE